jgi:hypothetical protein
MRVLVLFTIATLPACSHTSVKAPAPNASPADFVDCTEQSEYPALDRRYSFTSFAMLPIWAVAGGAAFGIDGSNEHIDPGRATAGVIVGGLVGVLMGVEFLSSAHYGEKAIHDCVESHVRAVAVQRSVRDPLRGQYGHLCRYFESGWSCDGGLACREFDHVCVASPGAEPPAEAGKDDPRRRCISDIYEGPICPSGKHCGAGGTCEVDRIEAPQ